MKKLYKREKMKDCHDVAELLQKFTTMNVDGTCCASLFPRSPRERMNSFKCLEYFWKQGQI